LQKNPKKQGVTTNSNVSVCPASSVFAEEPEKAGCDNSDKAYSCPSIIIEFAEEPEKAGCDNSISTFAQERSTEFAEEPEKAGCDNCS